jgi:hypothetical protein
MVDNAMVLGVASAGLAQANLRSIPKKSLNNKKASVLEVPTLH